MSPRFFGLDLEGDLTQEQWPQKYLPHYRFVRCASTLLETRSLVVTTPPVPTGLPRERSYIVTGFKDRSRLLAFDERLPLGTVFILRDKEGEHSCHDLRREHFEPVRVVTLGYLLTAKDSDWNEMGERLELRRFLNSRVAHLAL